MMEVNDRKKEKGKGKLRSIPIMIIIILAAVAMLAELSLNYISFLGKQLFEEHKKYITEFTEKSSEIVDGVIDHSWQQV